MIESFARNCPKPTKIGKVIEDLNHIINLGEPTYTEIKEQLDVILDSLACTNEDPIIPDKEDTVEKIRSIFVTEDKEGRNNIIGKLNNLVNTLSPK